MALVFEKKPLEQLRFIIQTGGKSPKVKYECKGLESFVYGAIMFRKVPVTPKGVVLVFGEDNTYRGYIKLVDGFPKKFLPEPDDEGTTFSDWYTEAGA